jgi:hypothetical protein
VFSERSKFTQHTTNLTSTHTVSGARRRERERERDPGELIRKCKQEVERVCVFSKKKVPSGTTN